MYNRIMVPLDGSELAECVLPHVESIVRNCSTAHVTFIRVVEPLHIPTSPEADGSTVSSTWDAQHLRNNVDSENMAIAEEYVTRVAARNRYPGAGVEARVIMGKTAETLADYAQQHGIDLIVIATHGLSGISRWIWGSTADRVLRAACVPVLIVRAPGCISGF
ncbi:MAG: universal stress protein [Desulfobacterales bacterium]|nr:universal stress protein [Desulfobacterales bacterium]